MLGTNPYQEQRRKPKKDYERLRDNAPWRILAATVFTTAASVGAVEAFTHKNTLLGIGATVLALYNARQNVFSGVRDAVLDGNIAGREEGYVIGQGNALEARLTRELRETGSTEPLYELQEIWRHDPSYRGGQKPEIPVK